MASTDLEKTIWEQRFHLNDDEAAPSVDEARRLIDEDIQDLSECIRARRSRRNTYAPISKLPKELLCAIFRIYQQQSLLPYSRSPAPGLEWIVVSHVAKTWREAALNYANLWTDIPWSSPKWIPEMVKRSKDANFTIRMDLKAIRNRVAFRALCDLIHANPQRIREITLSNATMEDIRDAFKDLPHSSALCLQSLTLTPSSFSRRENFDGVRFVENYLGDASDLRHVDLFWTVGWNSRILTGLTHLTIRNELMVQRPLSTEFFGAIRRMPRLEELHLYGVVLPSVTEEPIPIPDDIIELPLLRSLLLSGTAPEVASFLFRIRIPPNCNIDVECTPSESSPSDSTSLISALGTLYTVPLSSDAFVPSTGFLQFGLRYDGMEFRASRLPQAPSPFPQTEYTPFLSLTFTWNAAITITPSLTENIRRILVDSFNALPFQNLSTLTLGSKTPLGLLDDYTFLDALGSQPKLEDIQVETGFIKQFLDYMAARTDASNTPFPVLRTLYLYGIDLQQLRRQPSPMQDLLCFVRQRKELGVGLSYLSIERCYRPTADDMRLLRDSVERVFYTNKAK